MILKFRAWSKVNIESPEMREVRGINWHGHNVWFNDLLDDETPADWADFDDIILMQSTGLFDKNGVEILEGDVVKFHDVWSEYDYEGFVDGTSEGENFTEIVKTVDGFSFGITKIPESSVFYFLNDEHMKFSEIVKSDVFGMVAIGNIHENPHLLETKEDNQ